MHYKYPFTKQDGIKNCACACMQMIIKYYKGYMSLDDLSWYLKTNKNGTSAYNIIKVFEEIGFESSGIKASLKDINRNNLILPTIAHVTINKKYNHYIVIYKIDFKRKKLLIADPASNIKTISFSEFEEIWNNVLIIVYPVKPIVKNNEVKLFKFILNILTIHKKNITEIFLISVIYLLTTIGFSFYLKLLFDSIDSSKNYLLFIFLFFTIVYIIKIIANFFRNKLLIFVNQKIDITIIMDVYKKIMHLPYQYYRNRTTGEIISKINDLEKIRSLINNIILTLFIDLPFTVFSGLCLYFISPNLFFMAIFVLILYIILLLLAKVFWDDKIDKLYESKATMTSFMYESINGFETVKGLNIEKIIIRKFENIYIKYLKKVISFDHFLNNQNFFRDIINGFSEVLMMYLGILLVFDNKLSIGSLIAFNSISIYFFSPIRNILSLDLNIMESKKAIKKVYEMFEISEKSNINKEITGNIKISNLNYSYDFDNSVLKKIDLNIKKGEKVLITGESGSGKSTLLKILMKYYEVERNKVIIDGNDINDINNIKDSISYISQNEILFTDSLYNNINICNADIDKFTKIANDCCVDDVIKNNKLGYNMVIEENGFNISGGQKQRIILSRALLSNYNILLIDEGLNQIDISMERKILKKIFDSHKEKTMIFISHRLENLDLYDRLIEIENGLIIKDEVRCQI